MSIAWWIWLLLGIVWVSTAAVTILLQRRSAAATIAWLLVLVLLPVIGLLIYRLIGPLRLERKRLRRRGGRVVVEEATGAMARIRAEAAEEAQVAAVPLALDGAPPLPATDVALFLDGRAAYASIVEAIEAATHHVHLEYYIWEPDGIGTRLRDALVARARAGVKVRMLVDGTGSAALRRRWLRPLRDAGVEVAWFNPVSLRFIRTRRVDFRTHRKIVICDGHVAFTGGMNITDAHSDEFGPGYWRDTHLRVDGTAVWALQRVFLEDWYFAAGAQVATDDTYFPLHPGERRYPVQIVASGPDHDRLAIHRTYFTAITRASHRLWITTPYFVPDDAILTALITAALRGVDVQLLIPARGDSRLIDLAARSYVPELVAAGVRVHEYLPRFIHAKTFVIDEDLTIVGTANLDNRSFQLNFEVTALVYDADVTTRLARAFEDDLRDSRPIDDAAIARKRFPRRLGEATARLLSPLL
ncbi:MAG: cardiolipin synthase [Kofleriaceae bacterium]|nr:cardiolipin synthase [Kofleriaceae bacterium]MCB9575039.1 cardiolipin synthase [Kofleriaceae bacterium]